MSGRGGEGGGDDKEYTKSVLQKQLLKLESNHLIFTTALTSKLLAAWIPPKKSRE